MSQMNISTKQKDSQTQRTDLRLPKGRWGGKGMNWKSGFGRGKLLHLEWTNDKDLMYSTGTIFCNKP